MILIASAALAVVNSPAAAISRVALADALLEGRVTIDDVRGADHRPRALRGALLLRQGARPLGGGGDSRRGAQRRRPHARRASERTAVEPRGILLALGRFAPWSAASSSCSESFWSVVSPKGWHRGRERQRLSPTGSGTSCSSARSGVVRTHTCRHPRSGRTASAGRNTQLRLLAAGGLRRSGCAGRVPSRSDRRCTPDLRTLAAQPARGRGRGRRRPTGARPCSGCTTSQPSARRSACPIKYVDNVYAEPPEPGLLRHRIARSGLVLEDPRRGAWLALASLVLARCGWPLAPFPPGIPTRGRGRRGGSRSRFSSSTPATSFRTAVSRRARGIPRPVSRCWRSDSGLRLRAGPGRATWRWRSRSSL